MDFSSFSRSSVAIFSRNVAPQKLSLGVTNSMPTAKTSLCLEGRRDTTSAETIFVEVSLVNSMMLPMAFHFDQPAVHVHSFGFRELDNARSACLQPLHLHRNHHRVAVTPSVFSF
jgi:hypothetical protein